MRTTGVSTLLYVLVLTPMLLMTDCSGNKSLPGGNGDFIEQKVSVRQVKSIERQGQQLAIDLNVEVPNPCWTFSRYEINETAEGAEIVIFAKKEKDAVCIQMVGAFDTQVSCPIEGDQHRLRFWQGESTTLDTLYRVE